MFRRIALTGKLSAVKSARAFHAVVPDIHIQRGAGIPGLLSPRGVEVAWFEYQRFLMTEIQEAIEAMPELDRYEKLTDLMEFCTEANTPELRPVAVLTSKAYTNEFFFRSLRTDGSVNPNATFESDPTKVDISNKVLNMPRHPDQGRAGEATSTSVREPSYPAFHQLEQSFGSVASFRQLLINQGDAMLGNGAVWLVTSPMEAQVGLLNTYGWGTPFSHPKPESETHGVVAAAPPLQAMPALCINLCEHVYLHDYGVAGRRKFLENAFDCIDWSVVDERLTPVGRHQSFF